MNGSDNEIFSGVEVMLVMVVELAGIHNGGCDFAIDRLW